MRLMLITLAVLAAVGPRSTLCAEPESPTTSPLDDYVQQPDLAFQWEVVKSIDGNRSQTAVIKLTSQAWRSAGEVDRPVWNHWLVVVKPKDLKTNKALLVVGGGGNDSPPPDDPNEVISRIAEATGSIVAELKMIPNQPLVFHGDGNPRKEDDLIAYGWNQFLETGDATWLPRLPMVKSVARAMDCLQQWSGKEGSEIEKFVITGASKRGWTTWMIGAADPRVAAIIPIVIDVVNMQSCMKHHAAAYGFWATAVGNYYQHKILQRPHHPRMPALFQIEDPYYYLDRLTMPKYIVNSTGDQYFCPDSSQFYFDKLKGEKHLRYIPNTDHGLDRSIDGVTSIVAFYQMIIADKQRPQMTWTFEEDGAIHVRSDVTPRRVVLWEANNPAARDFRLETIGKAFVATELKPQADGTWVGRAATPAEGWTASLVELTYDSGGAFPFKVSTGVRVTPDTLPYANLQQEAVPYEPDVTSASGASRGE